MSTKTTTLRLGRHELFMRTAELFAQRSTCPRAHVGAVLVQDRRVVSTGYNGSPPGMDHCTEVGCLTRPHEFGCQRCIHAEANAIAWAARYGTRTVTSYMYCTHGPCLTCAKLMLAAGVRELFYQEPYRLMDGHELLVDSGVKVHAYGA